MTHFDYSALEPRPRHEWSLEKQLTLKVLVEGYDNEWRDRREIFHKHFAIAENELSESALRSMWRELKPKFRGSFGEWKIIREVLERTADNLNIILRRKVFQPSFGEPEFPISRRIIKRKGNEVFTIPSHRD